MVAPLFSESTHGINQGSIFFGYDFDGVVKLTPQMPGMSHLATGTLVYLTVNDLVLL